ncbi:hypothetical protein SCOCK_100031 [Actinacidiphila cocklensis]|uniref:Uncharacterized protein n=1 Tax=Actinacidiphila cocklensis TaxID=887465 RepID=A0A9W4DIR4_9ACTN|nr:hypothetical protein SCOCK_100031 [Actinacidiphila cocklensis]
MNTVIRYPQAPHLPHTDPNLVPGHTQRRGQSARGAGNCARNDDDDDGGPVRADSTPVNPEDQPTAG